MPISIIFISPLKVAQHVSGYLVPILRSWRLSGIFAACGVVPWLCRRSDPVGWLCVHWGIRSYVLPNGHTTSQTDLTAYTATALHHTRQKYH